MSDAKTRKFLLDEAVDTLHLVWSQPAVDLVTKLVRDAVDHGNLTAQQGLDMLDVLDLLNAVTRQRPRLEAERAKEGVSARWELSRAGLSGPALRVVRDDD